MLRRYHYVDLYDGESLSLTAKTKSQADVYAISVLSEPIFIKSEGVTNKMTREQILKDIIINAIIKGVNRHDLISYCYNILSVYYNSLEECLYDFSCDIVNSIIVTNGNVTIDLNNRQVVIHND